MINNSSRIFQNSTKKEKKKQPYEPRDTIASSDQLNFKNIYVYIGQLKTSNQNIKERKKKE